MIRVLIGNLFESKAETIVNTVNCVGVMGKGIALEFKKRFPDMMKDYKTRCNNKSVEPGVPYMFTDLFETSILNFPTKNHWRSPSKLDDIISGLDLFVQNYKSWGIRSIAFPPLGCGNGGLDWKVVGPLIYQKLSPLDIDIEVYAPFGTSRNELSSEFLSSQVVTNAKIKGITHKKLKDEWITLLEVLKQLSEETYAPYIGRTVFQKICYVITEQGIDTGFNFKQGNYGPYAPEVKEALAVFANANLAMEQEFGKMTRMVIGPEYLSLREKYDDYLASVKNKINKTVDLFSRIKNTEQAEEVTTVFYSVKRLKTVNTQISEKNVLDYVLDWKKHWDVPDKREAIASSIRHLTMLKWIDVKFSDELINEDIFV